MEDADWKVNKAENESTEVKDQEMKADGEEVKKEAKEEPATKIHQKDDVKDKFGGGGVHTNEEKTVEQYFGYYAKLANQQNMLQDQVRTNLYYSAIRNNPSNFMGKTVMDVGCGSGILSLFAAQSGAKKVYAVEASNMAKNARKLVEANGFQNVIEVIESKVEDITPAQVPLKTVDVIVSEPLGTFLLNERMLETYIIARDMFLRPKGLMFPNKADLCVMPF